MKIVIHAIGHFKESYWKEAQKEYEKRLKGYASLEIVEYDDVAIPVKATEAVEEEVRSKEGKKILSALKPNDFLVLLDLHGPQLDSVALSQKLEEWFVRGSSTIHFAIGGSLGFSAEMKKRGNAVLTLSELTFPHQIARILLLEQLYRSFRILHHEPYHK